MGDTGASGVVGAFVIFGFIALVAFGFLWILFSWVGKKLSKSMPPFSKTEIAPLTEETAEIQRRLDSLDDQR